MSLNDYTMIGPVAYRGKKDCTSVTCTRLHPMSENPGCMGWHCSYCDEPCSMMGHRCDASKAILGESRRVAEETP